MTKAGRTVALVVFACAGTALTAQQPQPPHKPDHMEHRFDDPERYAKSFDDPARDAWQMPARVIDALALSPTSSIADIGAGTGYFSIRLAKAVPRGLVYAVDIEPAMLEHVRKRAAAEHLDNVVTVQASGTSPKLPKPVDRRDRRRYLPPSAEPPDLLQRSPEVARARWPRRDHRLPEGRAGGTAAGVPLRGRPDHRRDGAGGYRLDARHDFLPRQHFLVFSADRGR